MEDFFFMAQKNRINIEPYKKKILPFLTAWMDLNSIRLREISHTEKDKYHKISFKCGI